MSTAPSQSWLKRLAQAFRNGERRGRTFPSTARPIHLTLEGLEERLVPAGGVAVPLYILGPAHSSSPNSVRPQANVYQEDGGFTPLGIQTAYGVASLPSGDNGAGQTIAVIDAYDDPKFLNSTDPNFASSDLAQFDAEFGLPNPVFVKVSQTGSTTALPGTDPAGAGNDNWEIEEALDVEYAHTMAPQAKIMLVECNSDSLADLLAGVDWAAASTAKGGGGATVVSMSFGQDGGFSGETANDGTFSPTAFPGVTFLASTGDDGPVKPTRKGTAQADYPADSPDVVAVGGTNLQANATTGAYLSETAWNELSVGAGATGGGVSNFESQPSYQATAAAGISTTHRVAPDVAFDADPYSGVVIYDSYNGAVTGSTVYDIGGTSLASPLMAGVVAVADQIRVAGGGASLTGATQTLPILYSLYNTSHYSQDFHDVASGSVGGYSAGKGYDALTGLGTPIVNNLVFDLAGVPTTNAPTITSASSTTFTEGTFGTFTVTDAGNPFPILTESGPTGGLASLGLTFNPATGILSGTPTASGVYSLSFTATNTVGFFTQNFTLTVMGLASTQTSVVGLSNPAVFGNPVTFTATVANNTSSATPTGSVQFFDNGAPLGNGSALTGSGASAASSYTATTLTAGQHSITAIYTPTGGFVGSTSLPYSENVSAVTTTGVSSSVNPSVFGGSVIFTATITDASGTASPTGAVEFFDGTTDLGPGSALAGSGGSVVSTFTTKSLPPGDDAIKAVYTPTGTFVGGNNSLTQHVQAVTTTAVASSLNASVFGGSVTFTATIANSDGTASPTGAVEFFDGTTDLGPGTTLSGTGASVVSSFTISSLPSGLDNVIAVYTASGDFVGGQGSINQNVEAVTTTGVSSLVNPSVFGGSVIFTATITNTSSTASPTGAVEFFDGTTDLGPGSALAGSGGSVVSTFMTSSLPTGDDSIKAVYTPTGDFVGGSGGVIQHVQADTQTSLASTANPSVAGNPTTFTATIVNKDSNATPTGAVEFFDGTTDLGPGTTLSGTGASVVSSFTLLTLPVGSDAIQAVYTPTGDFVGGSGAFQQVVTARVFPTPPAAITSAVLKADGELDLFNQQSGAVTVISAAGTIASITTAVNASGQTVVFAIVEDADANGNLHTMWGYNPLNHGAPWSEMSTGSFTQINGANTPSSVPLVYGIVADGSLWEQNPANGTGLNIGWTELSDGSFRSISPVSTSAGVMVYGIVAGGTLWEQNPANGTGLNVGWTELSDGSFQSINGGVNGVGQTVVYAVAAGGTLWEQNPANGTGLDVGWTELSGGPLVSGSGTAPAAFLSVASSGADSAFALATDHTLWLHKTAGWLEVSTGSSFVQISATESATGADLVFAALSDGSFWDYNGASPSNPWSQAMQNGSPLAGATLSSTPS